jgi:predicted PurR-regulated permease PerM
MRRDRLLVLVLIAATGICLYLCYLIASPFLSALAWALALAIITHPLHRWINGRIRHPNIAATLSVLLVAIVILGPVVFVTHNLVQQATASAEQIKAASTDGLLKLIAERNPRVAPALAWLETTVDVSGQIERAAGGIASFMTGSIWAVGELLITLFLLFFLLRDRDRGLAALRSVVPLSESEANKILRRVADTIHATVFGTLMVAAVQGTLGGLMFWWLGLPAPLLWGVIMGLLAIVPVLGAFMIWVPAALFLGLQGDWGKALILTVWGTVVIGLIDNLLYPMLVGKKLRLHTVLVFIAIVGGLALFGGSGLILGPVVLAITDALIEIWRRRTSAGRAATPAT